MLRGRARAEEQGKGMPPLPPLAGTAPWSRLCGLEAWTLSSKCLKPQEHEMSQD